MPNQSAQHGGHGARAAEQQDQREADHEGRRDDRQDAHHAQELLVAEARCASRSARRRGRAAWCRRRRAAPRNSVFQATPQRRSLDRQSRPQIERSRNLVDELRRREVAAVVGERARQDRGDREEDEDDDQRDDDADRARRRTRRRGTSRVPRGRGRERSGTRSRSAPRRSPCRPGAVPVRRRGSSGCRASSR